MTKSISYIFTTFLIVFLSLASDACAYDFCEKNEEGVMIYYSKVEEGYCEVAESPEPYSGDITIPEKAGNLYVVGVGYKAFMDCKELTSITLPNTVLYLESVSFAWCESLDSVHLGENIKAIGNSAFESCLHLSKINIPESLEYCAYFAFFNCMSIKEPLLNSRYFFYFPDALGKVYSIPEGIEVIGESAFSFSYVEHVKIPNTVTTIEDYAFDGSLLKDIDIPSSVTSIGSHAFSQCWLSSVTIPETVKEFGTYVFCSDSFFLKKCTLKNHFDCLPEGTFADCSSLEKVELPEGVTSIGNDAFSNDMKLTTINLPEHLDSIGKDAFYRCEAFTTFKVPEGVKSIRHDTFSLCSGLKSISLPSTLESIDDHAFWGCTSLESITVPESVTTIGIGAFCNCTSLKDVYVPWETPISFSDYTVFGNAYSSLAQTMTLHVPSGTKDLYANAPVWKQFSPIVEDYTDGISTPGCKYFAKKYLHNGKLIVTDNNKYYDASGKEMDIIKE